MRWGRWGCGGGGEGEEESKGGSKGGERWLVSDRYGKCCLMMQLFIMATGSGRAQRSRLNVLFKCCAKKIYKVSQPILFEICLVLLTAD